MKDDTNKKFSRRTFFKTGSIIAGGIIVASTVDPINGLLFASAPPKRKGPWYGIAIDIDKCIGCGICYDVCKFSAVIVK